MGGVFNDITRTVSNTVGGAPKAVAAPLEKEIKATYDKNTTDFAKANAETMAPDFTDQAVRARRMAQTLQLMSGRGRKQSFLGGDYGAETLGGGSMLGGAP